MHSYQIDQDVFQNKIILALLVSVIFAYILNLIVSLLSITIPWFLDMPSVFGFFGFFLWLYDNYLWKLKLFQKIEWFKIPNLNGKWETEIRSSFDNFKTPMVSSMLINQTASKMSIISETTMSISQSNIAAILRAEKHRFELTYTYINKPKADSVNTMQIHYGTGFFSIKADTGALEGEYYTGRGRQTFGTIKAHIIK